MKKLQLNERAVPVLEHRYGANQSHLTRRQQWGSHY
jgi:hypothetical protein